MSTDSIRVIASCLPSTHLHSLIVDIDNDDDAELELWKVVNNNLVLSSERRRKTVSASNAMYVLWSRRDDPKRQHLVNDKDLRSVIVEKRHLLTVCRELWRPKW